MEQDSILLLGYSILYKEYNLTRFNHQKSYSLVYVMTSESESSCPKFRNVSHMLLKQERGGKERKQGPMNTATAAEYV